MESRNFHAVQNRGYERREVNCAFRAVSYPTHPTAFGRSDYYLNYTYIHTYIIHIHTTNMRTHILENLHYTCYIGEKVIIRKKYRRAASHSWNSDDTEWHPAVESGAMIPVYTRDLYTLFLNRVDWMSDPVLFLRSISSTIVSLTSFVHVTVSPRSSTTNSVVRIRIPTSTCKQQIVGT